MNEEENNLLSELYNWVDNIPLSRPKKNLARDFSDGGKSNAENINNKNTNLLKNPFSFTGGNN